ncbi:hypothetical protein [Actinophytocola sp.]|uniref:hypothetical protein n=1 Tax=Actinophytocola sp. TaxID=1872138 RepID=UPI002ED487C2
MRHTREALKYYRATGNGMRQADALNSLGWYSARLGRPADGREYCEQALLLCRRHDHSRGETVTHTRRSGTAGAARRAWEQARDLYRAHRQPRDAERLDEKLAPLPASS